MNKYILNTVSGIIPEKVFLDTLYWLFSSPPSFDAKRLSFAVQYRRDRGPQWNENVDCPSCQISMFPEIVCDKIYARA